MFTREMPEETPDYNKHLIGDQRFEDFTYIEENNLNISYSEQ